MTSSREEITLGLTVLSTYSLESFIHYNPDHYLDGHMVELDPLAVSLGVSLFGRHKQNENIYVLIITITL